MVSTRQNILIETHALRQQAVELLAWLEDSHRQVQAQLKSEQREDMVRIVAGRSSLEQSIADTRRMIESLDRALEEARRSGESPQPTENFGSAVHVVGRMRGVGAIGSMLGVPAVR
jgi:predicted AAA+ superfamily ATPase